MRFSVSNLLLLLIIAFVPKVYSLEKEQNSIQLNSALLNDQEAKENIINEYVLGSGDILSIKFIGIGQWSKEYIIDPYGNLNLPEVGLLNIQGLTINELNNILQSNYQEYMYNPKFEINIFSYRPIKIYTSGELRRPGFYNIKVASSPDEKNSGIINIKTVYNTAAIKIFQLPTLYDAIQISGGITEFSDLSNIQIIRKNSKSAGGGYMKAKIDLIPLLLGESGLNNINLMDGDVIKIHKSKNLITEQIVRGLRSNLKEEIITVLVTGQIAKNGPLEIKNGTTLNQAIAAAGGKKIFSGKIEFLRLKSDGSVLREEFIYNPTANVEDSKNPILISGDIINIKRSPIGYVTEALSTITRPTIGLFGLYNIYDDLSD